MSEQHGVSDGEQTKHRYAAYEDLLDWLRREKVSRWSDAEHRYVGATSAFDTEYSQTGDDREDDAPREMRSSGWYQCKARYFNDIIVTLIGNASGKAMSTRQKKRSQLFTALDIDVCYPEEGEPSIGAEVKHIGTPPHPGNNRRARKAKNDLHKRVREVAFTSIDFKLAHTGPGKIDSFQSWIDSSPPGYFTFWSVRAENQRDFEQVRTMLVNLRTYCNGVGAVFFMGTESHPTEYSVVDVSELDMDRCIREIAQRVSG